MTTYIIRVIENNVDPDKVAQISTSVCAREWFEALDLYHQKSQEETRKLCQGKIDNAYVAVSEYCDGNFVKRCADHFIG